jgi:hypothetical protein
MLDHWEAARGRFVKVLPNEYVRALSELYVKAQHAKPAGLPAPAKAVA